MDNSEDRTFRSSLSPDLLILDDLGLHRLTAQQSADLDELILNRHRVSSFIITSNRAVEESLSIFDDSILGNSALDRLANAGYQFVIEGSSYRERLSPHRALLEPKGVIDQPTGSGGWCGRGRSRLASLPTGHIVLPSISRAAAGRFIRC